MECPTARALDVIGEWWTPLVIRDAFLGVRRFEQFQRRLGIARNILADRLDKLVAHGILESVPYQERPLRSEYRLTEKGRDLYPIILALGEWGDKWEFGGNGPVVLEHLDCGQQVHTVPTCSHCGGALHSANARLRYRPNADQIIEEDQPRRHHGHGNRTEVAQP